MLIVEIDSRDWCRCAAAAGVCLEHDEPVTGYHRTGAATVTRYQLTSDVMRLQRVVHCRQYLTA